MFAVRASVLKPRGLCPIAQDTGSRQYQEGRARSLRRNKDFRRSVQ